MASRSDRSLKAIVYFMNRNRNRSCLARGIVKPSALCLMGKTDYFRGQARKQTFALLLVIALTWIRLGIDRLRGKKKTHARYG